MTTRAPARVTWIDYAMLAAILAAIVIFGAIALFRLALWVLL